MKVKARLSNPLPKTQAVKGGMCGGFRIGRSDGGFPIFFIALLILNNTFDGVLSLFLLTPCL